MAAEQIADILAGLWPAEEREPQQRVADLGDLPIAERNLNATLRYVSDQPLRLMTIEIENVSGAAAFVQVFDRIGSGDVLGSTSIAGGILPLLEIRVADSGYTTINFGPNGRAFRVGLALASTTGSAGGTGSSAGVHVYGQYRSGAHR